MHFSTDAPPSAAEEPASTTTTTVSTSAASSGVEQALSTAESTLGGLSCCFVLFNRLQHSYFL